MNCPVLWAKGCFTGAKKVNTIALDLDMECGEHIECDMVDEPGKLFLLFVRDGCCYSTREGHKTRQCIMGIPPPAAYTYCSIAA